MRTESLLGSSTYVVMALLHGQKKRLTQTSMECLGYVIVRLPVCDLAGSNHQDQQSCLPSKHAGQMTAYDDCSNQINMPRKAEATHMEHSLSLSLPVTKVPL